MRSRLVLPALVLLFSLGSAGVAAAAPTQEEACFGEFSSSFARDIPKSGLAVSDMAKAGVVGTFASTKPICP